MGGKSSGGGAGNTTTSSTPWEASQPFLKDIMGQAQNWYNSSAGTQQFPGSTSVPLSADTQAALAAIRARATAGSPVMGAANQSALDTIQGKYLDPNTNPYLKSTFDQASSAVNSQVNGQFSSAGRYGSGAQTGVLADKNNQLATDIYGGNYQQERARQAAMTGMAPTLAQGDYADANALLTSGNIQQQQSQNDLQSQIDKFNFTQNNPLQRIQQYSGLLSGYGGLGGQSTQTQGSSSNVGSQIIGGLGTAASLAKAFSDRRLKRNIKRVATLACGLPVYVYNYCWGKKQYVGCLAQEVIKFKPEAVFIHPSGFYGVRYDMLGS